MKEKIWLWLLKFSPNILIVYYTILGRTDCYQMDLAIKLNNEKKSKIEGYSINKGQDTPIENRYVGGPKMNELQNGKQQLDEPNREKLYTANGEIKSTQIDKDRIQLRNAVDKSIGIVKNADIFYGSKNIMAVGDSSQNIIPQLINNMHNIEPVLCKEMQLIWLTFSKENPAKKIPTFQMPCFLSNESNWKGKKVMIWTVRSLQGWKII
ncbi:MAG: hypothetical protein ACK5LL_16385 [Suipraeoptans sp.]